MPTPALMQAISRLDAAVTRAEAALSGIETRQKDRQEKKDQRDALIAEAVHELDDLIATLKDAPRG